MINQPNQQPEKNNHHEASNKPNLYERDKAVNDSHNELLAFAESLAQTENTEKRIAASNENFTADLQPYAPKDTMPKGLDTKAKLPSLIAEMEAAMPADFAAHFNRFNA